MIRQTVKAFRSGSWPDPVNGTQSETESIENQMEKFLNENPTYKVNNFSTMIFPRYIEAIVVFDIREERDDKKYNLNKKY